MTRNLLPTTLILLSFLSPAYSQDHSPTYNPTNNKDKLDERALADWQTRRLPPAAFPGLPDDLVVGLQKEGCTIPQVVHASEAHNIIRGEFLKPGQTDWAVLCSKERTSSILIFREGSPVKTSEIATLPDKKLSARCRGWADRLFKRNTQPYERRDHGLHRASWNRGHFCKQGFCHTLLSGKQVDRAARS